MIYKHKGRNGQSEWFYLHLVGIQFILLTKKVGGIIKCQEKRKQIEVLRNFLIHSPQLHHLTLVGDWLVHYNYLRPHTALDDKTPAEVAGIAYPYKNWLDIIRKHKPSKRVVIEHQPRDAERLPRINIVRPKKRIRISRKSPRITPPMPMLSERRPRLK